ncbi:MAG: sulfatase [Verrucomicrobiota bacterium]
MIHPIRILAAFCLFVVTSWAETRPNIIVILADDLGYEDIACFGNDRIETPNIDALARDGIRFTDFHSNGAVCSPTRAALMTGRYQQRTGISGVVTARGHRDTGLPLKEITIAELVKPAGYRTALFGKWHLGYDPKYNPIRQGFDEFIGFVSGNVDFHIHIDQTGIEDWWKQDQLEPEDGYTTDLITKHSVEFIKRNASTNSVLGKGRPFLLYIAHESPHYPYQGRSTPPVYIPGEGRDKDKDKATPEVYKEMIEVMDEGIGHIRQAVEDAGLSHNTLIIFSSDNGPAGPGSAGPLREKKGSFYEGGHRVPTVAFWPGIIEAGRISNETLMGADLFPTFSEISGASIPEGVEIDGVSLLPHLKNAEPLPQRQLYWGIKGQVAVRRGDFKLIANENFTKAELYNLRDDIGETTDIADSHPELVSELLEAAHTWLDEVTAGVEKRT